MRLYHERDRTRGIEQRYTTATGLPYSGYIDQSFTLQLCFVGTLKFQTMFSFFFTYTVTYCDEVPDAALGSSKIVQWENTRFSYAVHTTTVNFYFFLLFFFVAGITTHH